MAEETKRCTEEEAAVNEAAANAEETKAEEKAEKKKCPNRMNGIKNSAPNFLRYAEKLKKSTSKGNVAKATFRQVTFVLLSAV